MWIPAKYSNKSIFITEENNLLEQWAVKMDKTFVINHKMSQQQIKIMWIEESQVEGKYL
jgi:hypothetical protein